MNGYLFREGRVSGLADGLRGLPIADWFGLREAIWIDRAIDRMPMRLIVRLGGALGSCEFCTGLIQLTARKTIRLYRLWWEVTSGH